jgi:hypothetical protein
VYVKAGTRKAFSGSVVVTHHKAFPLCFSLQCIITAGGKGVVRREQFSPA